jgi:hypothetical protein
VARYALGGASSDLAKGHPKVYAIQNGTPIYRSGEWDKQRIEIYQRALLEARLEAARLREILAGGAPARHARRRASQRALLGRLPAPLRRALVTRRSGWRRGATKGPD